MTAATGDFPSLTRSYQDCAEVATLAQTNRGKAWVA